MTDSKTAAKRSQIEAMPAWLRRPIGRASEISTVQQIIKQRQIHTICEEGRCPNRGECYAQKTAITQSSWATLKSVKLREGELCSNIKDYRTFT